MFKVHCVKCKVVYQDSEPDDYYCPPCQEENKKLAKELDRKIKPSRKQKSDYEMFSEQGVTKNMGGGQITFMRSK